MRIEELVLEGFKSYPVRTQITGWDPSFNAITGLNGSGKSNILDAICFVLGITNMSQMRAQNQQDLIYKRGQAGITKASVTIVFDNSDRDTSPVGFENCKQITVTRQIALPNVTKYLLNGHKSQQHTIQTLFQSVQLNINNPNFLIMQGRITKVLNMRPQEILGMVEEAAGTRMFEERKDKAQRTMGKKEKRVHEINDLLNEEITPKLDKLREEKRAFLAWQKTCSELERLARVLRAAEWTEYQARLKTKQAEIDKKEHNIGEAKGQIERLQGEIKAAEKDVDEVTKKRDQEMRKGGKFKKREEEVAELEKEIVKVRTQVEIRNGTIEDDTNKLAAQDTEIKELQDSLSQQGSLVDDLTAEYTTIKDGHAETEKTLVSSEDLLQSLLTGLTSSGAGASGGGGFMGQLADAKARLAHASTEEEQTRMKLGMSEKELKALEARWKEVEREAGDGQRALQAKKAEVESYRTKIAGCGWNEDREKACDMALRNAKDELRRHAEKRDGIRHGLTAIDFNYTSPSPNFDRSKVKGMVASLVHLDPKDFNKSTALEVAAGGKLYNVVVENETVGKDLLQKGQLKKRVTIIPLNKISASKMAPQKLQNATSLAPGRVRLALSLIGHSKDVTRAMEFVFGETLICDDAEAAKQVTFSPKVGGARAVTLDGDVYDPSGTLSGGAPPTTSGLLVRVQELLEAEERVSEASRQLAQLQQEEEKTRGGKEKWKQMVRELEIKEHELHLLTVQLEGSNATRVGAQVDALKKTIEELKERVKGAKDKQAAANEDCRKLEKDISEFKNNKEGKINELKEKISKQKAVLQKHSVVVKMKQKELQTAKLELEQIEGDIEKAKATRGELKTSIDKLRAEVASLQEQLKKIEESHKKAEQKLQEERATLTRFDNELKELERAIKDKKQKVGDAEVKLQELQHDIQSLRKEKTAATNHIAGLEKQYEWIAEEKGQFGKPGSQYDFSKTNIPELRERVKTLEESQKGMKKKVNPKVINMIDSVEKKEVSLKKMLATVMKDKEKIEETIKELDRYKRDALQKTWEKVNGDFGGIFAELLPGNFAKLQPQEGQDLMQGLEVKVQLGTVWKQSLTELSGGQRSLIALSLIMSLLQFKPAPMYILDEIDAALDLSHTQHIGQLFRTRFKGSQFIVVSLKEGLFSNANVLFRARFRDGTSIVERTAQRSTSALYAEENDGKRRKTNGA